MSDGALKSLCRRIGYEFEELELLRQALRHPSYTHENPEAGDHNQRLEFLGDAVVGLVVAEGLFLRFPKVREGQLTRWRAALVSEQPLSLAARASGMGDLVMLGRGEDNVGGRERPGLLCDLFEAVVGASFLDGGLEAARQVVETVLGDAISSVNAATPIDYKSKLQERIQATGEPAPTYSLVNTTGPEHDKRFEVEISGTEAVLGTGVGMSKKAAEQDAARRALQRLATPPEEEEE